MARRRRRYVNTASFYQSNSKEEWDYLLKPINYHYHFGFPGISENIFENSIYQNVFPFIADNSRILDCGCGWGAPAEMLVTHKKCKVTSVTNSLMQVKFIQDNFKNIKVKYKDLNVFKPFNRYDCAMFIESFSHVINQQKLLKNISLVTDNILFIAHLDRSPKGFFQKDWLMTFESVPNLIKKLKNVGYTVQFIKDLGTDYIIPTYSYWLSRVENINNVKGQLLELKNLCQASLSNPQATAEYSGLFIIYASKNL
jgi:hypothetical protein